MSKNKVRIELHAGQWHFVDNNSNKVKFDQAIVDATYVSKNCVEGFTVSVHGIEQEIAQYLDSKTLQDLGVTGNHRLGQGPTIRRIRLMQDGTIERAD